MDILLYKDGHLTISESPLQGKENNLDDVVMLVTNPQDGDTLTYKNGKWVNGEGGGGSFAPDITNPQDGDTLVYNATAGKWVNGSGGGGSLLVHIAGDSPVSLTLDKTWQEIHDALVAGLYVVGLAQYEGGVDQLPITNAQIDGADYCVQIGNYPTFKANSADGYPSTGDPK